MPRTLISNNNRNKQWRRKLVPCLDHWWAEKVLTKPTIAAALNWQPRQRHRPFLYLLSPTSLALYHTCSTHSNEVARRNGHIHWTSHMMMMMIMIAMPDPDFIYQPHSIKTTDQYKTTCILLGNTYKLSLMVWDPSHHLTINVKEL